MVKHFFSPGTWEVESGSEFKTNLAYIEFQGGQGYTERSLIKKLDSD